MVYIRSQKEVDFIRESSRIVFNTLNMLEKEIKPGVKGEYLDQLAEEFIHSEGGEPAFKGYMGYPSSLCISFNHEVVHGIPNSCEFREGDIVGIDCGVLKNGYYGDSARTYSIGDISKDLKRLLKVTEKSLYIGIKKAKSGNRVSDIGYAVQDFVEGHGFSVVRDLVGHGIGRQLHEDPQVPNYGEPGNGVELHTGMCLAIEPMVNFGGEEIFTKPNGWTICTKDGKPSAHFEHTIVVTSNGGKILSNGVYDG